MNHLSVLDYDFYHNIFLLNTLGFITLLCIFLVVYHHAFYPFLLQHLAKNKTLKNTINDSTSLLKNNCMKEPTLKIAMVIPAYNEEKTIKDKLYNCACLDYPEDLLSIYVVLDGCTDNTHQIIMQTLEDPIFKHLPIHVINHPSNLGKIARINQTVEHLSTDLIAFSDVSALVSFDALSLCAQHFTTEESTPVGVVTGFYRLLNPANTGEQAYWQYQCKQQLAESAMGAVQGAHGAFYMIKADLFKPLAPDTINDDFVIPMQIVERGYQAIMEPNINALELEQTSNHQEASRRVRIAAGNIQQLFMLRNLLNPKYRNIAFMFASGKTLRVFMPHLMVIAFVGSMLLAPIQLIFALAFAGQLLAYGLGLLSLIAASRLKIAARPLKFLPAQFNVVIGLFNKFSPIGYLMKGHYYSLLGSSGYLLDSLLGRHRQAIKHKENTQKAHEQWAALDPTTAKAKRCFDIIIASTALLILSPLMPIIALAIKLESRGPVLFSQVRIGLSTPTKMQFFTMYKFRSMVQDAEKTTGATLATKNDARITRMGLFLRKTRLDELPQLFNVLRGDMSIVGPRPERPDFYGKLEKAIPFFAERTFGVMPGITGLAQVHQGYDTCIEDVRSKVGYDHGYALALHSVKSWLRMDLWIMFKTIEVMVTGRGQ